MLELMAMSYIVSVCLYLARQYPNFPKMPDKQLQENATPLSKFIRQNLPNAMKEVHNPSDIFYPPND